MACSPLPMHNESGMWWIGVIVDEILRWLHSFVPFQSKLINGAKKPSLSQWALFHLSVHPCGELLLFPGLQGQAHRNCCHILWDSWSEKQKRIFKYIYFPPKFLIVLVPSPLWDCNGQEVGFGGKGRRWTDGQQDCSSLGATWEAFPEPLCRLGWFGAC